MNIQPLVSAIETAMETKENKAAIELLKQFDYEEILRNEAGHHDNIQLAIIRQFVTNPDVQEFLK